jgi:NitT/TauT family transport system substrate-binding protein
MVMQLAVKPGSGITSIAQLRGKKIGPASLASTGLTYAKSVLKDAGIDPEKDIQVLPVGSGVTAADALYRGRVDALALWDSAYAVMENAGFKLQLLPHPKQIREIGGAGGLIVRRDFVKNNRELAIGLARASAKGTIFMLENPEALVRLHWKMFPETKPVGVDEAKALADEIRVVNARADKMDPNKSGVVPRWGVGTPEEYIAYAKWLGVQLPDLGKYYDMSLVERINDFDAEKVRRLARSYKVH